MTSHQEVLGHSHDPESQEGKGSSSSDAPGSSPTSLRAHLESITWAYFSCNMATGALASVLYQTPNRFPGLDTIGKIVFILDLVLFLLMTTAISARFILNSTLGKSLHHPTESFFFGAFWVSVSLILQNTAQYGTSSCGPWLIRALEICFWLYAALVLLVAIFQSHLIFFTERQQLKQMVPAWILPWYPLLVTGPLVTLLMPNQPAVAPIPMLIAGVTFQGLGWFISIFVYGMFMIRLLTHDVPPPSARPGMYIAVGPTGYTATALVGLGNQASSVIPAESLGIHSVPVGDVMKAIGFIGGVFLWLLGFWFLCLATLAVLNGRRDMEYSVVWWAFIFPNAGLTLATIQIGKVLDSPGVNGVASAMTLLLAIAWLLVVIGLIRGVWQKRLMFGW